MTENQKLREACNYIDALGGDSRSYRQALALPTALAISDTWGISRALVTLYAYECDGATDKALALITADHIPDAGEMVADHLPDAGKMIETAAPVGEHELPPLPVTSYQLYYQWSDDEDGCGGSEVVDGDAYTADQMRAYARAALSAGDAVDAQRYRLVRRGQHFSVINGIGDMLRGENLDFAIDAAMRKGQL